MARSTLFSQPFLGSYLRSVGVIPLKRGAADPSGIRYAVRLLRQGEAVAIFPEGGRQMSGQLGTAKRGLGVLAAAARVPVIPVLIKGTFEAWPPGGKLRRAKIRVAFGSAIPYTTQLPQGIETRVDLPTDGGDDRDAPGFTGEGVSARSERQRLARASHEQLAAAVTRQWHLLSAQLDRR